MAGRELVERHGSHLGEADELLEPARSWPEPTMLGDDSAEECPAAELRAAPLQDEEVMVRDVNALADQEARPTN